MGKEPTNPRRRILDVALKIFAHNGYAGASIQEIVDRAGVTKPTLYYHFKSKEGLFHASVSLMRPQEVQARIVTLYKRFCAFHAPLTLRKQRVQRIENFFGDRMARYVYLPVNEVTFFVMAHPMIEELLGCLIGVGTRYNVGFGSVRSWEIKETPEDWSIIHEGIAMRPIPVRLLDEWEDSAMLSWRPPYWGSEIEECCVPFTGVTIKGDELRSVDEIDFTDDDFFDAVEDLNG